MGNFKTSPLETYKINTQKQLNEECLNTMNEPNGKHTYTHA